MTQQAIEEAFVPFAIKYGKEVATEKKMTERTRIQNYLIQEFAEILKAFKQETGHSIIKIGPMMRKVIDAYPKDA